MKTLVRMIPISAIFIIAGCSSSARAIVSTAERSELAAFRKVAAVSADVQFTEQKNNAFLESFVLSLQSATNTEEGRNAQSAAYSRDLSARRSEAMSITGALENEIINRMNMDLLRKGFSPLERSDIVRIMQEQAIGQSGLFDSSESLRIGRLSTADAVLVSRLNVAVVGVYSPKCVVTFSAKMVSVSDGRLLASGQSVVSDTEFTADLLYRAIDEWFAATPDLHNKWNIF